MANALESLNTLRSEMEQSILGQSHVVERLLLTLLCNGNALLEGLPGLAKTRAVRSLADNLHAELSRIQFTPDLLPSDITGSEIYLGEQATERFEFQPGPIISNLVLADEINRAPAKVQAALLEAMEERQVTVNGTTHKLPELFMVLATQNPVEQEGTYPLPEAQMDRFLMHIQVNYPDDETEQQIIRLVRGEATAPAIASEPLAQQVVFDARKEIAQIETPDSMERYIVAIIAASRRPAEYSEELGRWILVGASPRGSLALDKVSRAHAWLNGRSTVTPDDIRGVAHDCLRHRLMLSYEARAEGVGPDEVISALLNNVAVE
ncbi:AAA family ATPase [Pontiella sulfatireligans]|uniref:ATPase RavA n=1 Tax=Pontiella sulfatireligans TaxID=2750658 RepID=A0A6C2UDY3_9BACT|nr:MoxR family ATPase [Pontiella sulfatireligans]VGO18422.1 ATPase RavA [Pontiella sulfatireligans]